MTEASSNTSEKENFINHSRLAQPEGLSDMLLYRLNRLRAVGGAIVLRFCEGQFGITRREWVIIALLIDEIETTSTDLAKKSQLSKSAISKALSSLQSKGLILKTVQPSNHRFSQIRLSDTGRSLYDEILPLVKRVNQDLMALLEQQQIFDLDAMLVKLESQAILMTEQINSLPKADRRHGGTQHRTSRSP